jgi:hypothetical protein
MQTAHGLTENLAALLRREHDALAEFLVALADFDRRRAWAELGYPSLFYFLHRELHLSKGAAQYRKVAAELIEQVPAIVEPLRRNRYLAIARGATWPRRGESGGRLHSW